jgi:hypothetical protein
MEEAMLFRSPGHALRWAYETTNRPIVKTSSINGMRGASGHGELTPQDRHAQAALIMTLCDRVLSPLHIAYIKAQFGRDSSGFDILVNHLAAHFGTGLHNRRAIEQIIRGYCGDKLVLADLKSGMRVGYLQAVMLRSKGYGALDKINSQAMGALWREMEQSQLLMTAA